MSEQRVSATPRQTGYLWGFSRKYKDNGQPIKWADLAKEGKLNKAHAISIIKACKNWEENPNEQTADAALIEIRQFDEGFIFKDKNSTESPKPNEEPKPAEEKPAKAESSLGEIMSMLENMLRPDIFDKLKKAIEEEKKSNGKLPEHAVPEEYIKPEIFDTAIAILNSGNNLCVYGPAGCGKSRMAEEIATVLDREFFNFSMSGGMRYTQVFGGTQLQTDENGNQVSKWVAGPLLQAVQRPAVVNIDEIFAADADVALGLNSLLEKSSRRIVTPDGVIEVHPECVFIATANTNGRTLSRQYTGAQRADDSLIDRFAKLRMEYSTQVENQMIVGYIANSDDRTWTKRTLENLRESCRANNIAFDPSTRRLITFCELYNAGLSRDAAFESAFLYDLSPAERGKVEM